jgi:PEP-CTERM motif
VTSFSRHISRAAIALLGGMIVASGASATQLVATQNVPPPANDPISFFSFPTAGDAYCSATDGCGTIPAGGQTGFQWTTGDYVLSSVFDLPTASVTDLSGDWTAFDNLGGSTETWSVYVNGVSVGTVTLPDVGGSGTNVPVSGTVNFAGIAPVAGGYQVELILQNTVPGGNGSVAWLDGGTTGLSYSVPEPSTWAMMLAGFAGLGFAS